MSEAITNMGIRWVQDDGGREAAGFSVANDARDCVCRALTIATCEDYGVVYEELAFLSQQMGGKKSARDGLPKKVYAAWLAHRGWEWTPTMSIGSGCQVHLRQAELPAGRLIVRLSGHLAAVVDGVLHDTHDCSREGTRCVYGYWNQG